MMSLKKLIAILGLGLSMMWLVGCSETDQAANNVENAARDAADAVGDAVDDAADAVEDATN